MSVNHTRGEPVLWKVGLALLLAGFALAVIAALLPLLAAPGALVGVGGCIIVLFVPVCFGVGSQALPLLIVAIALSIVLLAVAFIVWRVLAREVHQVA
ncbi:MAG: hypothetical protein QW517_10625 [Thermofilaceae archaeon]